MPNYATEIEGTDYVSKYIMPINQSPWTEADINERQIALNIATKAIDNLNFAGCKADPLQENQFPRVAEGNTVSDTATPTPDSSVPEKVKFACIELALTYLDNVNPDLEIQNLNVKSFKHSDASATYDDAPTANIAAGIPSNTAWRYLMPFLADIRGIKLSRV